MGKPANPPSRFPNWPASIKLVSLKAALLAKTRRQGLPIPVAIDGRRKQACWNRCHKASSSGKAGTGTGNLRRAAGSRVEGQLRGVSGGGSRLECRVRGQGVCPCSTKGLISLCCWWEWVTTVVSEGWRGRGLKHGCLVQRKADGVPSQANPRGD